MPCEIKANCAPILLDPSAVARVDGVPVAEEIRRAIGDLVAERRADTEFQARLRRSIGENQAILDRLAR